MPTINTAPPVISFNKDPMIFQAETTRKSGSAGAYEWTEENLSGYLQVFFVDVDDNESFLAELNPSYNNIDGKYAVNLGNLAPLVVEPPTDESINDFVYDGLRSVRSAGAIYVKYGDQFGIPKLIEDPLTVSAYYQVIAGSTKYWNGLAGRYADPIVLLHSWKSYRRRANFNQFYKQVLSTQPEYISVYIQDLNQSLVLNVRVYKSDDTFVDITMPSITLSRGVTHVPTDMARLGISSVPLAQSYRIGINSNPSLGYLYHSIIDQEPDNVLYMLMDNGCGGVETVRLQGQKTFGHEVSYVEHERPVFVGSNFRDGQIDQEFKSGVPTIGANSGYFDREYIEHISQLLYGKVWLIDTVRSKFLRYRVTSTSVQESDDSDDLYNLKLTFAQGWRDHSSNTFNQ